MDWPKILYDLFGTRFPITSQIAVTLLGAVLFGGAWWVLARHARLSAPFTASQTVSLTANNGPSPKPSEKDFSETAEISSQDELRILVKSYSNEKADGIVIYLYNDRQSGIGPSILNVKDAASFDIRKNWFRQSDPVSASIASYTETKSGRVAKAAHWKLTGQDGTWLLRVSAGGLILGDTGRASLAWPEGDVSTTEIWKLTLSVIAKDLSEWNPQIRVKWERGSKKILISSL